MRKHDSKDYEERDPREDCNRIEIPIDNLICREISSHAYKENFPHNGKRITKLICSPNMKYVATASDEDNSIFGWSIVLEHSGQYRFDFDYLIDLKESKFDHSTAPEEFKSNHSTDSEESDHPTISKGLDNSRIKCILSGVSDCKHISLMTNVDIPYNFEIFDITSGSWKMLNVQGLTGIIDRISFLENGDMAIIKGSPVYRAYIFSKPSSNNKHEWKCTSCIELSEYNKCVISQKGKLLILSDIPFVIMQWNLKTLELETQYVLDLNFSVDVDIDQIQMELNGDSTLLAVAIRRHKHRKDLTVYVYSTKSSTMIAKYSFKNDYDIERVNFVGSKDSESLLIYCEYWRVMDPYILSDMKISKKLLSPDSDTLVSSNPDSFDKLIVISDYIIRDNDVCLQIQRWNDILLHEHDESGDNLENELGDDLGGYNKIDVYSCGKEIRRIVQSTLEKYKIVKDIPLHDLPKKYSGKLYTWTVEHSSNYVTLKVYENEMEIGEIEVWKHKIKVGEVKECRMEFQLLKSEDLMMASSFGTYIWTANANIGINLLYFWFDLDEHKSAIDSQKALITQLEKLQGKFNSENLPPLPYFGQIIKHKSHLIHKRNKCSCGDLLEFYFKDERILKLYGKELIHELIYGKRRKQIKDLFIRLLDLCLLMLKRGEIFIFTKIMNTINSSLLDLELFDKDFRFTERFLSKTAFLISDAFESYLDDSSTSLHLESCGTYVHLFNTSLFDRAVFWISEKWKALDYSSLFTSHPKKTVKLAIPLLNFATYPEEYSAYDELIHLPYNPFTSFNTSEYYKWWNIKALVKFKWDTYGKNYYFTIWAIYSLFLSSFATVSTIPQSKISWESKKILLVVTIILGFFHFIFEVRQFIQKPQLYVKSLWNWFDLAAILFPTIVSLSWLLYETLPPLWIITLSVLFLEIKFILFFRALDNFGTYFAIMIGVAKKVFSFLVILGVIILAFSHSLHLLLRPTSDYSYDQPSYADDENNPWNLVARYLSISSDGIIGGPSFIATPDENTNLFAGFDTALLAVYFMLTGDSSAVSPWILKKNWTLVLLLVMFSFFTTIYLLNLFIGLLGMAIDQTNNEESFLCLRGEILSEIELLWMLPYQRRKKNWFPEILYYEVSVNELKKYVKKVKSDYDDSSRPYLSPAILKISEYDKDIEEKIDDLYKKMEESDKRFDKVINLLESITQKKNEVEDE